MPGFIGVSIPPAMTRERKAELLASWRERAIA